MHWFHQTRYVLIGTWVQYSASSIVSLSTKISQVSPIMVVVRWRCKIYWTITFGQVNHSQSITIATRDLVHALSTLESLTIIRTIYWRWKGFSRPPIQVSSPCIDQLTILVDKSPCLTGEFPIWSVSKNILARLYCVDHYAITSFRNPLPNGVLLALDLVTPRVGNNDE